MIDQRKNVALVFVADVETAAALMPELEQFKIEMFQQCPPDLSHCLSNSNAVLAFVEVDGWRPDSWSFVSRLRRAAPGASIIALVRRGSEKTAVDAFRAGVHDYLPAPLTRDAARDALARLRIPAACPASPLLGDSGELCGVRQQISHIAAARCNVLITGETGTGKELAAREIHQLSPRARHPLVCVNCAAIPETLLESELFGFDRGAFTGAHRTLMGQLEAGSGGTVLLDEIGDLPPSAQAKLLRAIETKEVQRLGSRGSIRLDIRVVAATSRDLEAMVNSAGFRADLYFRLNVGRLHLPPLRERPGDIRVLVTHFVAEFNREYGLNVCGVEDSLMDRMERYAWPGNVRELKNVLESSFVSGPGKKITSQQLPEWFRKKLALEPAAASESEKLLGALRAANWNKTKAAAQLHWSRMTLYRKMAQYKLLDSGRAPQKQ